MTDHYALVGNPVAHSLSPRIHKRFARQTGEDISYELILAPQDAFGDTVGAFAASGGKGANVTLPFKEQAFELADELGDQARRSQAVNTLVFRSDATIYGDNTDGAGLLDDLRRRGCKLEAKTVLILGAGGACRGIVPALLSASVRKLVIVNRTHSRAVDLAKRFARFGPVVAAHTSAIGEWRFDGVINATSASLNKEMPSLADTAVSKLEWGYDLAYAKQMTPFVAWLRQHGVSAAFDGIGMLVCQAARSFEIWRGVTPQIHALEDYLSTELEFNQA